VAAEIAAPLTNTKKLTMVSVGQNDVGISKMTTEVLQMVERLPKMVEGVTGIDITKVCSGLLCSLQLQMACRIYA
jgi:flotillin